MKLIDCEMCDLKRSHISIPTGHYPANVMFIFSREYLVDICVNRENEILRILNYDLNYDWYKTYAVKCCFKENVSDKNIKNCRKWLKFEIDKVNPALVVIFGKIAMLSLFGKKWKLRQNVFYVKNDRKYFVCESVNGDVNKLNYNIKLLSQYIKEYYR
jgi:hypothetical protein